MMVVVGKESNGAFPERNVAIDEYIGRAGCGELGLNSGAHVGAAARAVGEMIL